MKLIKLASVLALSPAALLIAGCAAEEGAAPDVAEAEASSAAEPAPSVADGDDLLGTKCGQYLAMMEMAQPPKDASEEQKALAENAQDELFNVMMWAHGYATGKGGAVASAEPLTKAWMVDKVGKLAEICKADPGKGEMRLADAVAKL